jgi:hypothetical protein
MLVGCTSNYERLWNAMDVDVAATDGSGNPTEIFITDLGSEWFACSQGQNSKIIRVDLSGNILWEFDQYGDELDGAHNADLNDLEDQMIISDDCNDRVLVIDYPDGNIIWDSSIDCPELDLNGPDDANFLGQGILPGQGNLLITLRDDHWVIEVDPTLCDNGIPDDEIVWSFGEKGVPRGYKDVLDPDRMRFPYNADSLPNGNVMIADGGTAVFGFGRMIEIDYTSRQIVWIYRGGRDCTIKGVPNQDCPGLGWARDADVECGDPACDTGMVFVTGMHVSLGVLRDLTAPPLPGESIPRGRELIYEVQHPEGFCYDTDTVPQWDDDDNGGQGFFLVSNHGPDQIGNWVLVVPVDATYSGTESVWRLDGLRYLP